MLVYKVSNEDSFPSSCLNCPCNWCSLPMCCNSRGGVTDRIKKAYLTKRHKDCPLIKVGGAEVESN